MGEMALAKKWQQHVKTVVSQDPPNKNSCLMTGLYVPEKAKGIVFKHENSESFWVTR